jgi:hypothetical protein
MTMTITRQVILPLVAQQEVQAQQVPAPPEAQVLPLPQQLLQALQAAPPEALQALPAPLAVQRVPPVQPEVQLKN